MADQFFLSRLFDSTQAKVTDQTWQYDPVNLTTHALVTGMFGSGNPGVMLCLDGGSSPAGHPGHLD